MDASLVRCDGSPGSVAELTDAFASALDGGPPVFPYAGQCPDPVQVDEPGGALIIETSGSTGAPKRVLLGAEALVSSAEATAHRLGGSGRWLLALPAHHVAGAQVIVRGLLAGHRPHVLDSRDGFRPERFAAATAELPAGRRYTSLVPTQLHRVLTAGGAALAALRSFEAVLVGGAAMPATLLNRARDAGLKVVTTYGMTETAGGCVYDGVPLDGVAVRLDPRHNRVLLGGPVLASGYLDAPDLTATAFADGWFHTSDVGRRAGDGRLQILGRLDDVITTGGEKVHPAAVERVLTTLPGVRAACVVGLADPEWGQLVAAALVTDTAVDPAGLREAVRVELGAPAVPRLLQTFPELPLRGIGKPDRAAVTRLLDLGRK